VQAAPGWRPLEEPKGSSVPAPFARLARTQAFMVAGDTLVALALAGSLFFSISPDAARSKVALYLLLTMAPFAVVAPLVGPWIDRAKGGRRTMVILSAGVRAVLCILMIDDLGSVLLFPEALIILVLGKSYSIARASLVPGLVRDEGELVEANAKLVLVGGIVGFAAAIPGLALYQLGPGWVLTAAGVCFAVAALAATRIPSTRVATAAADAAEKAELRGGGILLAASAMGVLRGIVGFLSFHLAFWLRGDDAETYWFGIVLAASALGSLAGAGLAPLVRTRVREERILLGCLAATAVASLAFLELDGRASAAALAFVVGMSASAGKLSFDAIVQRDAPDANQGRSFARFETRFQLAWVAGAFLPVVVTVPLAAGYVGIAIVAAVATILYATGRHVPVKRMQAALKARVRPPSTTT
jgi:hypothetical protein